MRVSGNMKMYSPTSIIFPSGVALRKQRTIILAGKPAKFPKGWLWYLFHGIWLLSCVITCSDFYPLSNQINIFMFINIWGETLRTHHLHATATMLLWMWFLNVWDNVPMDLEYACQQYLTCMWVFFVSFGIIKQPKLNTVTYVGEV
jgi:hypothetical protein